MGAPPQRAGYGNAIVQHGGYRLVFAPLESTLLFGALEERGHWHKRPRGHTYSARRQTGSAAACSRRARCRTWDTSLAVSKAQGDVPSVLSTFFQLSSPPITSSTCLRSRRTRDVTCRVMGNSNGHVGHVHLFSPVLDDGSTVTTLAQFGQKSMRRWQEKRRGHEAGAGALVRFPATPQHEPRSYSSAGRAQD